jgi:hypothetical protein
MSRSRPARVPARLIAVATAVAIGAAGIAVVSPGDAASRGASAHAAASPHVLLVGSYHGKKGQYKTIQSAVDAAAPGDWILIGPGDYHETGQIAMPGAMGDDRAGGTVVITKPGLHLRGMDRNGVMVDGTKPGAPQCSSKESDQNFGPADSSGATTGRNGIVVYKADGVYVENLSACNFLNGSMGGGDTIWWDGGGATGHQNIGSFWGGYLSSTSTYWKNTSSPSASYGIYVSNTHGPGTFIHTYASNMSDSSYYVGACPDCNTTLNDAHGQYSDLGYSGSNSGGHLLVENSEFDHNETGFATTSQNNDDAPSPEDGICPNGTTNPNPAPNTQRKNSCWLLTHNKIHDNNNGATPSSTSAPGLVGTGVSDAGGRHLTITANQIYNNNAWGVLLVPFPDTGPPPDVANCNGGIAAGQACYFDDFASEVANNTFSNNGSFGNPSNGDIGEVSNPEPDGNCYHGNVHADGSAITSDPPSIESTHGTCGQPNSGDPISSPLAAQATCDSQLVASCPSAPGANYPRSTDIKLPPLAAQTTMPNPCAGVPANAWCNSTVSKHAKKKKKKNKKNKGRHKAAKREPKREHEPDGDRDDRGRHR